MMIRNIHKKLAFVFWVLSLLALTSGIAIHIHFNTDKPEKYRLLIPANIILMVSVALFCEFKYRQTKKNEDDFIYDQSEISQEEFEKRVKDGEQLVILDNMVIDVSQYAYNHPGGAFLLEYNVGRDVSKFFYGSYALDGNGNDPSKQETERHTHSNIARKIANKNRVGFLK